MSTKDSDRDDARAAAIEEALGGIGQRISEAEAASEVCECKQGMFALAATRRQLFGGAGLVAAVGMTGVLPRTGAAKTTLSEELLASSKAVYKVERNETRVQTADGRISTARLVNIESMKVGAFALKNISALVCRGCVSLLGQASLSKFDIKSSRIQGVEFLTLVPR